MGKAENFFVGLLFGLAAGIAAAYLFGPARRTTFDAGYRSRWDRAVEEGRRAEQERKEALESELAEARRRNTPG